MTTGTTASEIEIEIGEAKPDDLPAMIAILAEGQMPHPRDAWSAEAAPRYRAAFDEIAADPATVLLVARRGAAVLGLVQLNFVRLLAGSGALKVNLESVFVAAAARGRGIGRLMIAEAERRARERGASHVLLASNKQRVDAHRFYRDLGYPQSHEAFKKSL